VPEARKIVVPEAGKIVVPEAGKIVVLEAFAGVRGSSPGLAESRCRDIAARSDAAFGPAAAA
jgi:hypothetical protein